MVLLRLVNNCSNVPIAITGSEIYALVCLTCDYVLFAKFVRAFHFMRKVGRICNTNNFKWINYDYT